MPAAAAGVVAGHVMTTIHVVTCGVRSRCVMRVPGPTHRVGSERATGQVRGTEQYGEPEGEAGHLDACAHDSTLPPRGNRAAWCSVITRRGGARRVTASCPRMGRVRS